MHGRLSAGIVLAVTCLLGLAKPSSGAGKFPYIRCDTRAPSAYTLTASADTSQLLHFVGLTEVDVCLSLTTKQVNSRSKCANKDLGSIKVMLDNTDIPYLKQIESIKLGSKALKSTYSTVSSNQVVWTISSRDRKPIGTYAALKGKTLPLCFRLPTSAFLGRRLAAQKAASPSTKVAFVSPNGACCPNKDVKELFKLA